MMLLGACDKAAEAAAAGDLNHATIFRYTAPDLCDIGLQPVPVAWEKRSCSCGLSRMGINGLEAGRGRGEGVQSHSDDDE